MFCNKLAAIQEDDDEEGEGGEEEDEQQQEEAEERREKKRWGGVHPQIAHVVMYSYIFPSVRNLFLHWEGPSHPSAI